MDPVLLAASASVAALLGGGAYVGMRHYVLPKWIRGLCGTDDYWTQPPENRGVVSVAKREQPIGEEDAPEETRKREGFSGGAFRHAILRSASEHLNDPRKDWFVEGAPIWEVLSNDDPAFDDEWDEDEDFDDRWEILREVGAYWVGFPWIAQIFLRRFRWSEILLTEDNKQKFWTRERWTRYWFALGFPYAMEFDKVRTADQMSAVLQVTVTMRITNPLKALFETDNWLTQVQSLVGEIAKNYAAGHTYAELRGEAKNDSVKTGTDSLANPVIRLTDYLPKEDPNIVGTDNVPPIPSGPVLEKYHRGTRGHYGVTITEVALKAVIIPAEVSKKLDDAAANRTTAGINKETTIINAEANAEATRREGFARAEVIERQGQAEAKAAKAKMDAYKENPALAEVIILGQAAATPGNGKTIFADLGGIARAAREAFKPEPKEKENT